MKQLKCEMCGSTDLIKQEGVFACQSCGCKYSLEEAKKMMVEVEGTVKVSGTVNIDNAKEVERLLVLARRARDERNNENAEKYYGMVSQNAPNNWEAAFFQTYYRAMQCRVGEIGYYADVIANNLQSIPTLINNLSKAEQTKAIETILVPSLEIANLFASVAVNHYNEHITVDGVFEECVQTVVNSSLIFGTIEVLVKKFCTNKDVIVSMQKSYVVFLKAYSKFFKNEYLNETITRLANEIRQVDSTYAAPTVNNGCYVATCVYGSYDCPQVWTLRRFRDNTLGTTWYGRMFIRIYYAISPILVKWFGKTKWFKRMWQGKLDKMVAKLNGNGVEDTPYQDKEW